LTSIIKKYKLYQYDKKNPQVWGFCVFRTLFLIKY
jgi:hypothetical protein